MRGMECFPRKLILLLTKTNIGGGDKTLYLNEHTECTVGKVISYRFELAEILGTYISRG